MTLNVLSKSSSMAVVVHCSSVPTGLNSGNISRRSRPPDHLLTVNRHYHGKLASHPLKIEKIVSSIGEAFCGPLEIRQILSGSQFMHLGLNEFHVLRSKLRNYINHVLCDCENTVQPLSAQQGMMQFKLPAMALLVANALMLTAPLKALAETCEANNSDYNMPLLLLVSLVGATVGGLLARQRKGELQRLNEQLRQINASLRRQAKIESYAPSLSYAPVGSKIPEEVIVDPKTHELISHLKTGKIYLRNQNSEKAYVEFKAALDYAQIMKDPIREKKAARGLGASLQRQGKYKEAIKYHSMVLDVSAREGETSGNTEAYGAIADCYTELGDLDQAGKYYDMYIARLETD